MTDEFDIDAFPGLPLEPEPPRPPRADAAVQAAIERERERMQHVIEPADAPRTRDVTPARTHLRALVYASRSGGGPHVVTLHELPDNDGHYSPAVLCICEATRNLARRPQGCWAMVDARDVFGLAPIGGD